MGKLLDEWQQAHIDDLITTQEDLWEACKAKAIELCKADSRLSISDKKRTWEDVFRDL